MGLLKIDLGSLVLIVYEVGSLYLDLGSLSLIILICILFGAKWFSV